MKLNKTQIYTFVTIGLVVSAFYLGKYYKKRQLVGDHKGTLLFARDIDGNYIQVSPN
jgi:hypothetical protein